MYKKRENKRNFVLLVTMAVSLFVHGTSYCSLFGKIRKELHNKYFQDSKKFIKNNKGVTVLVIVGSLVLVYCLKKVFSKQVEDGDNGDNGDGSQLVVSQKQPEENIIVNVTPQDNISPVLPETSSDMFDENFQDNYNNVKSTQTNQKEDNFKTALDDFLLRNGELNHELTSFLDSNKSE